MQLFIWEFQRRIAGFQAFGFPGNFREIPGFRCPIPFPGNTKNPGKMKALVGSIL